MPRFGFVPVEGNPFGDSRDTAPALQYASELGGRPEAGPIGKAFREDLTGVPNRLMQGLDRIAGRFEDLGNVLMGNRLVIQTPDGPIDVTNESMIDAGAELSGLVGGTGSLMSRPANSLGVFGGMNAKTADLEKLSTAMRLEQAGVSPEMIWKETGWGKGKDGKWKFEIPDGDAEFQDHWLEGLRDDQAYYLGQILDHPELFDAYPSLSRVHVKRETLDRAGGSYYAPTNELAVKTRSESSLGADPTSTVLHEVQHAIQSREGFAMGGSPVDPAMEKIGQEIVDGLARERDQLKIKISNSGRAVNEADVSRFAYLTKVLGKAHGADIGKIGYEALSGEVEARNVEKRLGWGIDTSRPPWETEDLPRSIQRNRWVPEWARRIDE